jgi:hypothetical protein
LLELWIKKLVEEKYKKTKEKLFGLKKYARAKALYSSTEVDEAHFLKKQP